MYIDRYGKKWYKGNTHTHTTLTDGRKPPEEVKALYKAAGYDFLCLTEHWQRSADGEYEGMTLISGVEYNTANANTSKGIYHVVCIGAKEEPKLDKTVTDPQLIIDAVNAAGGVAILAHPAWSVNRVSMINGLTGLAGVEVFNSVSDQPVNSRAYSEWIIDLLGIDRIYWPLVAADDSHWYAGEECRSAIMVRAENCQPDTIVEAIRQGNYYATQAPCFTYELWQDRLVIDCTPVKAAVFQSNREWVPNRQYYGQGMTHIEYKINPNEYFVRFELLDEEGNIGWSNPINLEERPAELCPTGFKTDGTIRA